MKLFNGIYKLEKRLDQGASAEVWKATDTLTNTTLALKIYSPSTDMGTNGMQMLAHEFKIMVNANHQNLLKPLHFDVCERRPFLVLPYCQRGNITSLRGTIDEKQAWTLLHDAAGGLAYLHAMTPPLIHQDIKPANILVADNGDFMLTDFGVSTYAKANRGQEKERDALMSAGTIAYMAPEKFRNHNSPIMLSDIWSLGVTVYEMLTGNLPFGNEGGLMQASSTKIPELPSTFSLKLNQTITSCLRFKPWDRPSAKSLYETASQELKNLEIKNTVMTNPEPEQLVPIPEPTPIPKPDPIPAPPVPIPEPTPIPKPDPVPAPPVHIPEPTLIPDPTPVPFPKAQNKFFLVLIIAAAAGLFIGIVTAFFT